MTCQGNVKVVYRRGRLKNHTFMSASLYYISSYRPSWDLFPLLPDSCSALRESPNLRPPLLLTAWHGVARLHSPNHCFVHVAPGSNT